MKSDVLIIENIISRGQGFSWLKEHWTFFLCLCGAVFAALWGENCFFLPLNRTELLLIYRMQSHTNPKRRKLQPKQAGQKSFKEEPTERWKAPKRAQEFCLKVQTRFWDHQAAGSNPVTRTKKPLRAVSAAFLIAQYLAIISCHTSIPSRAIKYVI